MVRKGSYVPNAHPHFFCEYTDGPFETGFSGGPVLDILGRCTGRFKGSVNGGGLQRRVFVKSAAILEGLTQARHGGLAAGG